MVVEADESVVVVGGSLQEEDAGQKEAKAETGKRQTAFIMKGARSNFQNGTIDP